MFVVVQRTDTLPEMRVLVNTDHIVAVTPVGGGVRSRLTLSSGEAWEVALSFTRAINLLRAELEIVEPVVPVERRPSLAERRDDPPPEPPPPGPGQPGFIDRRRAPR